MVTAAVIGSGPNGLAAAAVLTAAGVSTTVFEPNGQIGKACSTAQTTLPNFLQDLGNVSCENTNLAGGSSNIVQIGLVAVLLTQRSANRHRRLLPRWHQVQARRSHPIPSP
jgi:2-polyprenyl-6-methoxyphenol hydroxylase-like FAD-dependent oxidoreductase